MAAINENPKNPPEDWQVDCLEVKNRLFYLFCTHEWADCSFQFGTSTSAEESKNSLQAHRLVLAMASPVFAAMFYGNVGDKNSPVIINDIDLPTFEALLKYIYTDELKITDATAAMNLYKAAHKYILINLKRMCRDTLFKYLNPNNVCQVYEFASFYDEKSLEKKCLDTFTTETYQVLKGNSFRSADTNTVKKIVKMDNLNINNEMDLYNALLEYVDHYKKTDDENDGQNLAVLTNNINLKQENGVTKTRDKVNPLITYTLENIAPQSSKKTPEDARQILNGIIEEIRFLSMTPADLAKICENSTILTKDEKLAIFTNAFSPNCHLPMPKGFSCVREPRHRSIRGCNNKRKLRYDDCPYGYDYDDEFREIHFRGLQAKRLGGS
ncbi:BTB/POZ domain-containing protein [Phthorimaea operculella]|nr:BTB/POZ domain-containing protein [Phthorimaea operculella]